MVMSASLVTDALSDAERASIFNTLKKKIDQACFVDWVVGTCLAAFYLGKLWFHEPLAAPDMWPLIAALCITRAGDTLKAAAYWAWHKVGEAARNGDTLQ